MKYGIIFLLGAALAAVAAFTWPQEPSRKPHGLRPQYDRLDLSEEQRAKIEPLLRQLEERMGPLCRRVGRQRQALYSEVRRETPAPATIDAAIEAMIQARRELQRAFVDHLMEVKPILTAEQRARLFDQLAAERR
ncbi:MAG: periplasmic heavy metal sensor [Planctomycetes bacterium]|nr:periplasmic heavy metal sensor [Planctomycetota bacterium]